MEFFDTLVRYEVALWSMVDQKLAQCGVARLGQLQALRVLARYQGQARVQELSSDIGITVGAASKLVDRLEHHGLAVRRLNPADRRSSLVVLTEPGEHALAAGTEVCAEALAHAVGGEDVQEVTAVLGRLQARLDAAAAGAAA